MYELPTEIMIDERPYHIRANGDYRMVLDVFSILDDSELNNQERIISALIVFYDGMEDIDDVLKISDLESATKQMFEFFNGGRGEEGKASRKLIDWEHDANIISAAVNKVSGKEIRSEPYIHWWTFMSYYMSVGECILSTVVSIREKILKGKNLEKWEREYRIENPQYFNWNHKTVDEVEAENWLKSVWNKE